MEKYRILLYRLSAALLAGAMVCGLCACGGEDQTAELPELGATDLEYTQDHVSGTLCDGVKVDAEIPDMSEISQYDIVRVQMSLPDDDVLEDMKTFFFSTCQEDIKEEYDEQFMHTNYYTEEGKARTRNFAVIKSPGFQYVSWTNVVDFTETSWSFSYDLARTPESNVVLQVSTPEDRDFMSREEAVQTVLQQLAEWDLHPVGEAEVYSMDGDLMNEVVEDEVARGLLDYTKWDRDNLDAYFMIFQTGYQNIPYTFYDVFFGDKGTNAARFDIIYTQNGIVSFEYAFCHYNLLETIEQHDQVITLDQAMSAVKQHYEELVLTDDVYIHHIYFQYVPTQPDMEEGTSVMVPAWVVQPSFMDSNQKETNFDPIFIDAITGEVLLS